MSWIDRTWNALFRRDAHADDLSAEMQFHIDQAIEDGVERGLSLKEARAQAARRFGARTRITEETRDASVTPWLDRFVRDLRFAVRGLSKRPGLFWTGVCSLGLGIGAAASVFSVADGLLWKPVPLPESDRLMTIREAINGEKHGGNPPRLTDWASVTAFSAATGFYGEGLTLLGRGAPVRIEALRVMGDAMETLGVQPQIGRSFTAEEKRGTGEPVVLLTHRFWQRQFDGDRRALSQAINVGGRMHSIVGVLPEAFRYPPDLDVVMPAPADTQASPRSSGFLYVVARLAPDATIASAQAAIDAKAARMTQDNPATDKGLRATLVPLVEDQGDEARKPVLAALGTVLAMLLVACVNIASLLLVRAAERERESAIRVSLGASRGSLVSMYAAESLVIAISGCTLGLLLALFGVDALKAVMPADLSRLAEAQVDERSVAFSIGLTLVCAIGFAIAPALRAARTPIDLALRSDARSTGSAAKLRSRTALAVVQIALSTMLVCCAALMGRSLANMRTAPLGFAPHHLLTASMNFPWDTDSNRIHRFVEDALTQLRALPGVRDAAVVDRFPLGGGTQTRPITIRGRELSPALANKPVGVRGASPNYLSSIGAPLLRGEWLRQRSQGDTARKVVINRTLANLYFAGADPIGQSIHFGKADGGEPRWFEIAGVAGDVRQSAIQREDPPEAWVLLSDVYWPMLSFTVNTNGDPLALANAARAALQRLAPEQVIGEVSVMTERMSKSYREPEVLAYLFGGFALAALLLAAIGLYGVLASDVTQRTREIGIRLALGADRSALLRRFVWQGVRVTAIALAIGLGLAVAASRLLESLLYGVSSGDLPSLAGSASILLIVACAASLIPARRAARVDPAITLRHE